MTVLNIIFFIFFSAVGGSYTWGMRGTVIGGEKGAMLPGAMLGLILALFSGSEVLSSSPFLLAGIGAVSMYFGGNMTYADSLSLSMASNPPPNLKKGLIAVIIKGGIWLGIFGGFISMYISAISGFYSAVQMIIFFVILPFAALLGFKIFNTPFNPSENKYPKIYFSLNRRETWGGLLGILAEIFIFAAVCRDTATLAMIFGTALTGAVSWLVAQLVQIRSVLPNKHGKRLFGEANKYRLIDAWKVMECIFGAAGGIGTTLTFLISRPLFAEKFKKIDANGLYSILPESVTNILFILYGIILIADCLHYFIHPKTNRKYYKKLLKMNLIAKDSYEELLKNEKSAESDSFKRYKKLVEKSEFAVYAVIPLMMCFFGAAQITLNLYFCVILLVLCQEVIEKCESKGQCPMLFRIMLLLPSLIIFIMLTVTGKAYPLPIVTGLYTFVYEAACLCLKLLDGNRKITLSKDEKTVHGYFIICCLVINILIVIV